jgi:glycerol-3-phosphate acyltransferase PlsX
MNIAVDAMGGDYAPASVVEGAVHAAREADISITLVGDEKRIMAELEKFPGTNLPITIKSASEVIEMGESPSLALRKKKNSSIKVAMELVKAGEAKAVVSAGNTGAVLASSIMVLKPLKGIDRPTLATFLPTAREGQMTILVDAGANVDCKATQLFQFGIMGSVYAQYILEKKSPKIGLLSIGEEDNKGNEVSKGAFQLFSQSNLNFIGNVEAKEVFRGAADVLVCDGFTGNIALKIGESLAEMFINTMKAAFSQNFFSKIAYFLMKTHLRDLKTKIDYSEYGGAPLLGINGICIIGHGSSSPKAIKNAVTLAARLAKMDLNDHISREIEHNMAIQSPSGRKMGFLSRVSPYYKSIYSGEKRES